MRAPLVTDGAWQAWLNEFPAIFPGAYEAPADFRRGADRASLKPVPAAELLDDKERGAVLGFLDAINRAILQPARSKTWAVSVGSLGLAVAGAGAALGLAVAAVPVALGGVVLGGWGLLGVASSEAGSDGAQVVSRRLMMIMEDL